MERFSRDGLHSHQGSFLMRWLGPQWRSFAAATRRTPAVAWWRWAGTLLAGYVLSGLVALVCVRVARSNLDNGLQAWDERMLAALADSPLSFPQGLWFEAWGSSAFLVPMVIVAVIILARYGYVFRSLTLLVAYLSIKGLVLGTWQLWDRARPELIAEGIASPGLHSFPSGHAVNSVVLFGLLGAYWWLASRSWVERGLAALLISGVIVATCLGRVRLGTHWPSDIVAGGIIGGCWLMALTLAVVWAERAARP